jgi:glycosyltransferase involved in cell wall biosynthesis
MKMKILAVIDEFRPDENANSICFENVINELSEVAEISLITSSYSTDYKDGLIKKINIKRYYNLYGDLYKKYMYTAGRTSIVKMIFRIFNSIFVNFLWSDINYLWVVTKTNEMIKDIKKDKYDLLITSSGSFSSQQIGLKIRAACDIRWVIYLNDPLPDQNHLFKIRRNKLLNINKQVVAVLKNSDYILLNKHLYEAYSCVKEYSEYFSKMIEVDIPLVKPDIRKRTRDNRIPFFVYTGAFYKSIRNPEYMLEVLAFLSTIMMFEVHLFGSGDCDDIIREYCDKHKKVIYYHGRVSADEAREYINNADVLLNIGNSIPNQTPSKIFEYISTGKKIINFHSIESDTSLEYLRNYENAINIMESEFDIENTCYKIVSFLVKESKILDNDQLKTTFYKNTSEYSKQVILDIAKKL